MLIGYARVSTAEQNPDHQIDALTRAGVAPANVHLDRASGVKASRPKLGLVLTIAREGDTLVITRLDRLGRSVLHLITLGAQLRERGVGLRACGAQAAPALRHGSRRVGDNGPAAGLSAP